MIKTWFKRMQGVFFVSAFFIFTHKMTLLNTNDNNFFEAVYLYYRNIITNKGLLTPFIAIFIILSAFTFLQKYKKRAEIIVTIFAIVAFLLWKYPFVLQGLAFYYQYFLFAVAMIVLLLIAIDKTRKILTKATVALAVWSFKLIIYSTIFFEILINQTDVVFLIESYWFELRAAVYSLKSITDPLAMVYFGFLMFTIYAGLIKAIIFHLRRLKRIDSLPSVMPSTGVVIPAYNEENTILQTVISVLKAEGVTEIMIVNDGSTDKTLQLLIEFFAMRPVKREKVINVVKTKPVLGVYRSRKYPHLYLIDKQNGGKHDALNIGFQMLSKNINYVVNIDADVLLEHNSVSLLLQEMVREKAIAASGLVLPKEVKGNSILQKIQTLEYLTAFHISRAAFALTNNLMIISGAFGIFERYALVVVKGYKPCIGEDMFLCMELQDRRCKLLYVPEATIYTATPLNVKDLRTQRIRWFKGLMESLLNFKDFARNRMALAYMEFFFVEFLTPLMLPFGFLLLVVRPEILTSPLFVKCAVLLIANYLIQLVIAAVIENRYGRGTLKVSHILTFILLPLYVVMTLIWRNDAYLDRSSRKWGSITKTL